MYGAVTMLQCFPVMNSPCTGVLVLFVTLQVHFPFIDPPAPETLMRALETLCNLMMKAP
jgi:hypothetical protein